MSSKFTKAPSQVASARQQICNKCPHKTAILNRCKVCGCFLYLKTKVLYTNCPLGYWGNPTSSWGGR